MLARGPTRGIYEHLSYLDRRAVTRDERDAAHYHWFGLGPRRFEVDTRDHRADHLSHLGLSERRADQRRMPPPKGSQA